MASKMTLPPAGMLLKGSPDADIGNPKPQTPPTQTLQLELSSHTVEGLLRAFRGEKGVTLALGKNPTLHYGTRTRHLTSTTESFRTELYCMSPGSSDLLFTGLQTHKLEVQRAAEVTAGADAAMVALQNKMAALDEEKNSKKSLFVADGSKLPPTPADYSGKFVTKKVHKPSNFIKNHRVGLFNNGTTRSMPTSPALSATRSPNILPSKAPTSTTVPTTNQKSAKLQALRIPLIHLLAIGKASEKALAKKTRCSLEGCSELLQKVGKPAREGNGWELSDRWYKELDVWKFPYPTENERRAAIDNAISAFDRLRLSREDSLWQLLLPKHERGKGKSLSKLHLHNGQMKRVTTPSIKVQRAGDSEEERNGFQRMPHSGQSAARSQSQDPIKKKTTSEKEALSKRLLSNSTGSKKPTTQLMKTKKAAATKADSKIKSAERIEDSDEEAGMVDLASSVQATAKSTPTVGYHENSSSHGTEGGRKAPSSVRSAHRSSDASDTSRSSQQSERVSRPRTNSSPHKPSPLGSSPPTNASDFENDTGSINGDTSSDSRRGSQTRPGDSTPTPRPNKVQSKVPPRPMQTQTSGNTLKRKIMEVAGADQGSEVGRPAKRRTTSMGPPQSDTSGSDSPSNHEALQQARKFKQYYAKYEKLYRELSTSPEPPLEKVRLVRDMHSRLSSMKMEISRAAAVA